MAARLGHSTRQSERIANDKRAKDRPLANDFVTDEQFDRLLDAWFGNMARVLEPGRGFYIWGGYANLGNYPPFLKKHNLYFPQAKIFGKRNKPRITPSFPNHRELDSPGTSSDQFTFALPRVDDGQASHSATSQSERRDHRLHEGKTWIPRRVVFAGVLTFCAVLVVIVLWENLRSPKDTMLGTHTGEVREFGDLEIGML